MRILIVDDVRKTCEFIADVISKYQPSFECVCTFSYDEAIQRLSEATFDVLILDYELDEANSQKNGIALGKYISSIDTYKNVPIIFETSYPEHIYPAVNSLNCVYYMLKPFYEKDIINMIKKITTVIPTHQKLVFHNSVGIQSLINLQDIACIQSCHHDIFLYTSTCKYSFTNYSLSKLENVSPSKLIRCHKSYIVNIDYVHNIDKSNRIITILLPYEKLTIPIGRKYTRNLYTSYSED